MKSNLIKKLLLPSIVLLTISCSKEQLSPSGQQKTELRHTGPFTSISISGSSNVFVKYGTAFKVELVGSDNLLAKFQAKVENNELVLKYKDFNVQSDDIKVFIDLPRLQGVRTNGSASLEISGTFPQESVFKAGISGAGDITFLGSMLTKKMLAEVVGSGNSDLHRIISDNADISIYGSGNVKTSTLNHLKVRISGSGNVYYLGEPVLDESNAGSGKTIKM